VNFYARVYDVEKHLFSECSWLDFNPEEQVLYLEKYARLPAKEQTAEGALQLSKKIADRKV